MTPISRSRVLAAFVAVLGAFAVPSCSELFDTPAQCRYERDCAQFGEATCDLASGTCVAKAPQDAGADRVASDAGPLDAGAVDAEVDAEAGPPLPGPIARYAFADGSGSTVSDAILPTLDMTIGVVDGGGPATTWENDGLLVTGPALVRTAGPATKIIAAVEASSELTVEAWISPGNLTQAGPARIVEIATSTSANPTLHLGQVAGTFILRTSSGGTRNELTGGAAAVSVTHVVGTHSAGGTRRLLVNGAIVATDLQDGALETIAAGPLSVANDGTGERPWVGKLLSVSIFDRAMAPAEVAARFAAGP
jgi:hypothetical protein